MYNLTFEFNLDKLVQAIAYFSKSGIPDLTKPKIAKLLYFADKSTSPRTWQADDRRCSTGVWTTAPYLRSR